jgi:hypothetical protein
VSGVITHILCDRIRPVAKPVAPDELLRTTVRLANQRDRHPGDVPRLHHIFEGLVEVVVEEVIERALIEPVVVC